MDKVQKNRVLVTGAAGFIGANLCLKLFEKYENVHIIGIDHMNAYGFSQSSTGLVQWNFACFWDGKVYCNPPVPRSYNGKKCVCYMYCTYFVSRFCVSDDISAVRDGTE